MKLLRADELESEEVIATLGPEAWPDPPERFRTVVLDRIPLGRVGQPEDIVNAAIFLASDESSWISGTNIVIDGGGSALG